MTRLIAAFAVVLALEAIAGAQAPSSAFEPTVGSFDPDQAVAPVTSIEGPGVKVGEGTVLHPVFGVETGYVSNVFYTDTNPQGAALLRLLAQIGTGSLGPARLASNGGDAEEDLGSFQYRADLRASYDLMLSGNESVAGTDGLGAGASLHGLVNPMGHWSFGVDEDYTRLIRAANFETDANTNRDINSLALNLLYHPRDSSFGGYLYYYNTLDVFERSQQDFADRMFNRVGLHPTWQWLPQTQIFADVSEGVVTGIGTATAPGENKVTSFPFAAELGIATLLTLKTTFNLYGGYTNGFYESGPSFSAPMVGAQLGYRYSPVGRISLLYSLQYQDSINANYYRDHIIQLQEQQVFGPLTLILQPEIHFREYDGITLVAPTDGPMATRDDVIFAVVAGAQYNFKNRLAATLDYRFTDVSTDFTYMPINGGVTTNPSYVRQELLLGLRVAM